MCELLSSYDYDCCYAVDVGLGSTIIIFVRRKLTDLLVLWVELQQAQAQDGEKEMYSERKLTP